MKIKVSNILLSLIMTLTIISLAVVLTLACKPLYYLDIHALHIPETTGCTISEIKANYNANHRLLPEFRKRASGIPDLSHVRRRAHPF